MQKYNVGDVVEYIGTDSVWKRGKQIHIISECQYIGGGEFEYATTQGAWFTNKDFKLLRRADTGSFKELDKDLDDDVEEILG